MRRSFSWLTCVALLSSGCGSPSDDGDADGSATETSPDASATEASSDASAETTQGESSATTDTTGGTTAETGTETGDGDGDCPAAVLGAELGADGLMIGGTMEDASFQSTSFDLRYRYLAGSVPTQGPCTSCASGCTVDGESCDNANGCAWWGCWQYDQVPPGQFVLDFVDVVEAGGGVPMFTYYIWFSVAGGVEGQAEIDALNDGARVDAYLADWRFLMERLAAATDGPVLVHVEPDLWGYGHQISDDPTQIPVALAAAGDPACSGSGNHFAGLARCMLDIAREVAPNVKVGFHASAWGAGADALINDDASFDLAAHAEETAAYMRALGADEADLVVVEMSDRDAGFNGRWWDASDTTLPHFAQAIAWTQTLGESLDLAPLWWQVPYGNPALQDACDRYSDNRVDYVFDHPERFSAGGALGVAFGAGTGCMTTAETDDGHFLSRAATYFEGEPPAFCPP